MLKFAVGMSVSYDITLMRLKEILMKLGGTTRAFRPMDEMLF